MIYTISQRKLNGAVNIDLSTVSRGLVFTSLCNLSRNRLRLPTPQRTADLVIRTAVATVFLPVALLALWAPVQQHLGYPSGEGLLTTSIPISAISIQLAASGSSIVQALFA